MAKKRNTYLKFLYPIRVERKLEDEHENKGTVYIFFVPVLRWHLRSY